MLRPKLMGNSGQKPELGPLAVTIRVTSEDSAESRAEVAWRPVTNSLADFRYRQTSFTQKLFSAFHSRVSDELERSSRMS